MRVSTFFADTLPAAMAQVRDALGPQAVVLSWRNTRGGVEISASVQAEHMVQQRQAQSDLRVRQTLDLKPLAKPERREDLLSNHFSPDDFLPKPTQAVSVPKQVTQGLAALVKRQAGVSGAQSTSPLLEVVGQRANTLSDQSPKVRSNDKSPLGLTPHPVEESERVAARQTRPSRLTDFLTRAGLAPSQALAFAKSTTPELRRALTESIAKALRFAPIEAVPSKPLILVGPPGAGKSTCAAKLATRTIASGHEVLLISADSERCGGADQLAALAKRLGARFETVTTLADLSELVDEARQRGIVVFIDAPAACPAQPADMRATARMISQTRLEAVLCLPADMRTDDMEELANAYQKLGVKRAIATRLDLTSRRASVLHALHIGDLALAQISATPYISGGVAIATAPRLATLLLEPFEDALFEGDRLEDAA